MNCRTALYSWHKFGSQTVVSTAKGAQFWDPDFSLCKALETCKYKQTDCSKLTIVINDHLPRINFQKVRDTNVAQLCDS